MPHTRRAAEQRPSGRAHSAGGVVLRGEGADRRVAVMRSRYGTWVLPKGGIEPGETPEAAAAREIAEEIGLTDLELLGPLGFTEHGFDLHGTHYRKQVDWFAFRAPAGAQVRPEAAHGSLDAGWFTKSQALRLLTHADQRRMLRRAWPAEARRGE